MEKGKSIAQQSSIGKDLLMSLGSHVTNSILRFGNESINER